MACYGGIYPRNCPSDRDAAVAIWLSNKSVAGANTLETAWKTIHHAIKAGLHWSSLLLMVLTLVVKFGYPKLSNILKITFHIPASFVAIIIATLVVQILSIKTPQIGNLPQSLEPV